MTLHAKATALLMLVPLLLGTQSSSCRRNAPANNPTPTPTISSSTNVNKPQTNENRAAPEGTINSANGNKSMTSSANERKGRVPAGTWGGDHIRVDVRADGVDIEYDCAHGTINGPLDMDAAGRFEARGTHVREGGPVRIDNTATGRPARFLGKVDGNEMSITVTLTDSSENVGTFTLTRGSEGRLWKCR